MLTPGAALALAEAGSADCAKLICVMGAGIGAPARLLR